MATTTGWYLISPLIAIGLVVFLGAVFWHMGLQWTVARDETVDGLTIFGDSEPDDYGLLCAAAVTEHAGDAAEIRQLLADAGIRATVAVSRDGRTAVLVFAEHIEAARRLVH